MIKMQKDKSPPKSKISQYLQDYRFHSILVKSFMIILIFLIIIFTIVMITVSGKMNQIITEEVGNMSVNSLVKTRDRIDVVMEEVVKISGQLSLDNDIRSFMLPDSDTLFGHTQAVRVKKKIEMYSGVFDYIDSIYVYSHKKKMIVTNEGGGSIEDFEDNSWLVNLTEREYEPARIMSRTKNNVYPNLITYIQPLRLTQMQFLGGIIVNIDVEKLQAMIISSIKDSSENLMIVDNRNNILLSSVQSNLRKKLNKVDFYKDIDYQDTEGYQIVNNGSEDFLITVAPSNVFGWKYISATPLKAYEEYNDDIKYFYTALGIVCFLLSIGAAICISIYCYKPVKNILDLVKNPDLYHPVQKANKNFQKDETQEIALNIVRNLYSNRQLQEEMDSYADILNKAQLTALQAQINPHFLYNTLENIRWRAMAICKGDNEVSQMILNLSEMLRNSLDMEQQLITMEQEIKNTQLYIKILQLRYEDKLKVIWHIEEAVYKCLIVKVSLQPIIENAVYHGIKPLRSQGIITIRSYAKNALLYVEIEDNGMGMSQEELEVLNQDLHKKYILKEQHIGIRNVNQRLKLLMGEQAAITITSTLHQGTKVTLSLPVQNSAGLE